MATGTNTTQNDGEKYRKAQALVVEHLDLSPQDIDASKRFGLWKRKLEIYLQTLEADDDEKFNILILERTKRVELAISLLLAITHVYRGREIDFKGN